MEAALTESKDGASEARQRLAVRRIIRDAEELVQANAGDDSRFLALEFLFRAQQQLIKLDNDATHRAALLETSRDLVEAPDEYAAQRMQADLLLSQAELARQGANAEQRAAALRPFVKRYLDTPVGAKVLRIALEMALELGDSKLITDLQEMIAERYAADWEMIRFQREKLGGQVYGAPFVGTFERSDGKMLSYPMDGFGQSLLVVFWSKDDDGLDFAKGFADATKKIEDKLEGRMEIISFNLDDLPDAGESIIREAGADWQCLKLPGGREHPIYKTYAGRDPVALRVSSTGYAAIIMEGVGRVRTEEDGSIDYDRTLGSAFGRNWTDADYCEQLRSLAAGDHLVFDTERAGIDPALPPELKASLKGEAKPLARTSDSVPEATLQAIQACFVAPSALYRLSLSEIRENYGKAVELSRQAIAEHPKAPDLWIVRNRLITALLGLWKTDVDLQSFEQAVEAAEEALAAGYPEGCDVIARACLARKALRQADTNTGEILDQLVSDPGGKQATGSALAAAAMLALESADRNRFERYGQALLKNHSDDPMQWIFSSFLLDRHHRYWLFQVPFTAGWSYGRRETYFLSRGDPEEAHRILRTELRTADGGTFRIPEDLDAEYTAIYFCQPQPWSSQRDDGLPPSPLRTVEGFARFAADRPNGDVKVALATLGDTAPNVILNDRSKKEIPCMMLALPGGMNNPTVHRLGILSEEQNINRVLVDRRGRILTALSGLVSTRGNTLTNVVTRQDEMKVNSLLEEGKIEAAKTYILSVCPPFDPEAVDERGRKLRKPDYPLAHLRARARVYMVLKEWDKALADAEEVCLRQLSTDGGMSLRTDELDESEALRDEIRKLMQVTVK